MSLLDIFHTDATQANAVRVERFACVFTAPPGGRRRGWSCGQVTLDTLAEHLCEALQLAPHEVWVGRDMGRAAGGQVCLFGWGEPTETGTRHPRILAEITGGPLRDGFGPDQLNRALQARANATPFFVGGLN